MTNVRHIICSNGASRRSLRAIASAPAPRNHSEEFILADLQAAIVCTEEDRRSSNAEDSSITSSRFCIGK